MRLLWLGSLLVAGCLAVCACGPTPAPSHVRTEVRDLHEGQVVSGVPCLADDLPEHHIHVHLQIFLDGSPVVVPMGIGVGRPWGVEPDGFLATGSCFSWIHTHDTSGIVHIATPEQETFTFGQLFDVWGQPLRSGSALGYQGRSALLVNGQRVAGDPRHLPLVNLDSIVLELGRPPSGPIMKVFDGSMRS